MIGAARVSLRGTMRALWVLIIPTPAAFGPVTPGVTSQASVRRSLPDSSFSPSFV